MKQRTYKATGINLKGMPMGESDRLVTVLTKEHGLVRAIAPGARKHKSRLGGRSGLFVVNDALFTRGKSIDKLIQAETLKSFPGLSKDLAKLTASQYLAEIVLAQALTEQPQEELYYLFIEHLSRLEAASRSSVLPCLAQATFHFLALAGVAPEVFRCCLSRVPLTVELGNPEWKVGFSVSSGGAVATEEIERLECDRLKEIEQRIAERDAHRQIQRQAHSAAPLVTEPASRYQTGTDDQPQKKRPVGLKDQVAKDVAKEIGVVTYLNGAELALMQQLSKPELVMTAAPQTLSSAGAQMRPKSGTIKQTAANKSDVQASVRQMSGSANAPANAPANSPANAPANSYFASGPHVMWKHVEQALRQYAQYQFDRPIKSATLIDTCFS